MRRNKLSQSTVWRRFAQNNDRPTSHEFSRIQNTPRIERVLDPAVELSHLVGSSEPPPRFFREPNAMFPCDNSAEVDHPAKKFVQCGFAAPLRLGRGFIHHHIDVDVSIPGV